MVDRYRPLFKLDSGGMAEVYVAEAESVAGFKKKVAIKRILPGLLKEERFVRMFLDEARLSLHLSHTNIVNVFDIGKNASTYFIVMQYVEGPNLKHLLQYLSKRRRRLPIQLTLWILNEVLKGLDYAHNLRDPETGQPLGIVHRDISPPNILISWNGEVKLTDFGLAKASTQVESTDPGVVKGKFSYLSPEAASGVEVDARADLFAVGILAYEMLTGQRLFLGESDYQTVELVRGAKVPDIRERNPEVAPELESIVRRALARDANERYQAASEFADDLLGFLFSRGLKVSSRDLAEVLAQMREETAPQEPDLSGSNLIRQLIDEEFLDIRSVDDSDNSLDTGAQPLDTWGDPASPLAIEDFQSSMATPAGTTTEGSGNLSTTHRGRPPGTAPTRMPSPSPRRESNLGRYLYLAGLATLGAGAYYWLVVLGNLSRFTG